MIPSNLSSVTRNHDACGAYSDNLCPNEREGSLGDDAPPPDEPTGGSRNVMVLNERAGVLPITESNSITNVRISNTLSGAVSPRLS
jgi:hypothetical protein